MKTIVVFAFLTFSTQVHAQKADTCLVPWEDSPLRPPGHYVVINDDSVRVFMCEGAQYLHKFAKKKFFVPFKYYVLPDSTTRHTDTAFYDWRIVKSGNLWEALQSIEARFSKFEIGPYSPGDTIGAGKACWVNFLEYVNVDSAILAFDSLPGVDLSILRGAHFEGNPRFYQGVSNGVTPQPRVWPNPCLGKQFYVEPADASPKIAFYDDLGRPLNFLWAQHDKRIIVDLSSARSGILHIRVNSNDFTILISK